MQRGRACGTEPRTWTRPTWPSPSLEVRLTVACWSASGWAGTVSEPHAARRLRKCTDGTWAARSAHFQFSQGRAALHPGLRGLGAEQTRQRRRAVLTRTRTSEATYCLAGAPSRKGTSANCLTLCITENSDCAFIRQAAWQPLANWWSRSDCGSKPQPRSEICLSLFTQRRGHRASISGTGCVSVCLCL